VADHGIDHQLFEGESEQDDRDDAGEQDREPERQAEVAGADEDEKARQHDELALREVDRLRRLPEQREADRDQRVDRAGREACYEKL